MAHVVFSAADVDVGEGGGRPLLAGGREGVRAGVMGVVGEKQPGHHQQQHARHATYHPTHHGGHQHPSVIGWAWVSKVLVSWVSGWVVDKLVSRLRQCVSGSGDELNGWLVGSQVTGYQVE